MLEEIIQIQVFFIGNVQRVNLRANVKRYADELNLKGVIWNLPDGRVEMIVEGKKNEIEKLLVKIQENPGRANIEKITKTYRKANRKFTDFLICSEPKN